MRTWRKTSLRLRWVNRRTGCCRLPHKVDGRGGRGLIEAFALGTPSATLHGAQCVSSLTLRLLFEELAAKRSGERGVVQTVEEGAGALDLRDKCSSPGMSSSDVLNDLSLLLYRREVNW
jgi:hypothetical protein